MGTSRGGRTVSERWHIIDVSAQRVLQVCRTEKQAQRAQKRWYNLCCFHGGPLTSVRRVAIRDSDDITDVRTTAQDLK